jgi:hypothetical protein
MLGSSRVAAQLTASQEGLSSLELVMHSSFIINSATDPYSHMVEHITDILLQFVTHLLTLSRIILSTILPL